MGDYTAELTIYDERNGEVVDVLKLELEDNALSSDGVERIEEFVCMSLTKYEEDVWQTT